MDGQNSYGSSAAIPPRIKKAVGLLLVVMAILCPLAVASALDITDEATFLSALTTPGVHEVKNDIVGTATSMTPYQVNPGGDVTINTAGFTITLPQMITIQGGTGTHITFTGSGTLLKAPNASNSRIIYLNNAATLTINGCTLDAGPNGGSRTSIQTVYLAGGGTLNMQSGAITGGNTPTADGAAIFCSRATVNLSGGSIFGNTSRYGGGIYVTEGALNITGGTIENNAAQYGGGVFFRSGAMTLSGGEIRNNNATISGGGLYVYSSTLDLSGNFSVHDNSADDTGGGIRLQNGSTCTFTGGTIRLNECHSTNQQAGGGGIYVSLGSTLNMSGGEISENTAASFGGGIAAYSSSTINLSGTAVIRENDAASGGGIYLSGESDTRSTGSLTGNAAITQNSAYGDGGGIYLPLYSDFVMDGGSVTENRCYGSALSSCGGGVYVGGLLMAGYNSSFELRSGELYNNTALSSGSDVATALGADLTLIPATGMGLPTTLVNGWYWDRYGARYADVGTPEQYTPVAHDSAVLDLIAGYSRAVTAAVPDTGDNRNIAMTAVLALLSAAGCYLALRPGFRRGRRANR